MRKVAVVGMGGIFPDCSSIEDFRQKLFSNKSLIREWPELDKYGKQVRSKIAGYVTLNEAGLDVQWSNIGVDYPETFIDKMDRIPPENLATADVGSIWAMIAAKDAIEQSNWKKSEVESERTGVTIGSGTGGHEILRSSWDNFFHHGKKTRSIGSHGVDRGMVYRDTANVSCYIKNKGVSESIGSACACGLGNIGYAYRLIAYGVQDRMVAGGVEPTSIETFIGFDGMSVLSRKFTPEQSSRPFDKNRNGFVCSFGCGVVALEEYESAKKRGANILAVIDGYFNNSDGDGNMFFPSADGQSRLWDGLKNEVGNLDPDVVKAHGTSTAIGDPIELFSIVSALGYDGYKITAPKSQFGHMLGAAGAVEFIASVMMLQEQKCLPCLNTDQLNDQPEALQLVESWDGIKEPISAFRHLLPTETLGMEINQVVSLNYGFGGTNSAIAISKEN